MLFFDHSVEIPLAVLLHGTYFFLRLLKIFNALVFVAGGSVVLGGLGGGGAGEDKFSFLPLGVNCLILGALHFLSTDLWLDYIRFELDHPDNKASTTGELYWRATKCLEGQYTEKFVGLHSLLQARRV